MEFLKDKETWEQWRHSYLDDVFAEPKEYPCYAYSLTVFTNSLSVAYLYRRDLDNMLQRIMPAFVVYAMDRLSQASVAYWIDRAVAAGVPQEKIDSAWKRYHEIINFQSDNPDKVKLPD